VRRDQSGLAVVEFALIGATAMLVLFACIEFARFAFVLNTLAEATRRGARVAVVSNASAATTATLAYADYIPGMSASNVSVAYYTESGGPPTGPADTALVSVAITGYTHTLLVPFTDLSVQVPPFTTTLPVESMGIAPS
jgi:Flp pilus assembly protein TadG